MNHTKQQSRNRYVFLKRMAFLFLPVILITLLAYTNSTVDEVSHKKKNLNTSSVSRKNGRFLVDTSFIFGNISRNSLIAELKRVKLDEKRSVIEIPAFIADFLDSISRDRHFWMAGPEEEWQSGMLPPFDLVYKSRCTSDGSVDSVVQLVPKKVPHKQMVYFGVGPEIALMVYKTGSNRYQEIDIFKFKNKTVTDFWFGDCIDSVATKEQIIKYLKGFRRRRLVAGC